MTQRLTQAEVEARMYYGGIKRADAMMTKAEDKGRAHTNPYAKGLLQEYVRPLAQAVAQMALENEGLGHARPAQAILLAGLDYDAVAFLTVRTIVSCCLGAKRRSDHRTVAGLVGSTIRNELVLQQIEAQNPDLYQAISQDLGRRLSKDERHRMTVFKMQAKKNGVEFVEWPLAAREQVGMYLLGVCQVLGLVEIDPVRKVHNKYLPREVTLSYEVLQQIDRIKHFVAITTPVFGPCVERPLPWTDWRGGGYHTKEMQRSLPCLVRGHPSLRPLYTGPAPLVFRTANALQDTAWAVNAQMLDTVLALAKAGVRCAEVVPLQGRPKPPAPSWLTRGMTAEQMTEEQALVFREWKNLMRDWYEEHKLNGAKYSRFYAATRAAETFRGYPALHFVYFADSRGRFYPLTYGLNPQGSDLQRALIRFADSHAKRIFGDELAVRWFHVNGANLWGFDRPRLGMRQAWAEANSEQHLAFADDPANNTGWQQADKPLQYLAWCFEYRAWRRDPQGFRTALPVGQDGTCNGLQHLSAMLRDEVGGAAVNLTGGGDVKQDIYGIVAAATIVRIKAAAAGPYTQRWLDHGVSRTVVKRPVMTTPYGVTKQSAVKYVQADYLMTVPNPFQRAEYRAASAFLMEHAWPAIGDVLVKGTQAMRWLKSAGRQLAKSFDPEKDPILAWTTPSGFPAGQAYFDYASFRVRTRLAGVESIKLVQETDEPDLNKHSAGLAPNFVHSLDASHLHLTAAAFADASIDAGLAMVHDDYGTTAADSELLATLIRRKFVEMYEGADPLNDLRKRYPELPPVPAPGNLNIRDVLTSEFFFS